MPITSSDQFIKSKSRIMRHVRTLLKSGALKLAAGRGDRLTLGFAFDLKWVKAEGKTRLSFSGPDGIKVLLLQGKEVAASLDLHVNEKRVKFSHAQTGPSLNKLVTALNLLGERNQGDRKRYSLLQLHFPIGRGLYFKVSGGGQSVFFHFEGGQLQPMNAAALKIHFSELIDTRKPLTPQL